MPPALKSDVINMCVQELQGGIIPIFSDSQQTVLKNEQFVCLWGDGYPPFCAAAML